MNKKRLLIVGGVAGGASCATRARRLSEDAEIIIFERGPYVSFANCGLPYYIGDVITKEEKLLVASPELFKERFNIDVRTKSNVLLIDRKKKEIEVEDLKSSKIYREKYDTLVISPGSVPIKPKLEGIELPGIFILRTIPDMHQIINWIKTKKIKNAAVVGGGFIGLEMTENLKRLGINVTIIEMQKHVMPVLDPEMAAFIHEHLYSHKISIRLGSAVSGFNEKKDGTISIMLESGISISADMVILAIGVRPEAEIARKAGLTIGNSGGILVDDQMQTSDKSIWAVGDAVEVKNFVTGAQTLVPLAGPANRQGRIAADVILRDSSNSPRFRGVQATSVCGVLGMTIASTGVTEKLLSRIDGYHELKQYEKIYLHPDHHAGYYPDAKTITMKLIFSKKDGLILGAQAIGKSGVEKRIDVIAMAIQQKGTVFDLEEAELCYAPQYGSAKDPVNMAGMIAANVLRGYSSIAHWENLAKSDPYILDVRDPIEFSKGHVENAVNIPLNSLRSRISELPRDREIWIYCFIGQRSYYAERILSQNGYKVRTISGGFSIAPCSKKG